MYESKEEGREFYFHKDVVTENGGTQKYKKHDHELFEIYFIDSGSCCYYIGSRIYQLSPGDMILIPAGMVHNTEYKNAIHARRLVNCARWFLPASLRDSLCQEAIHYRNADTLPEIREIIRRIEWEYENPDDLSAESLRAYIHRLLILIVRNRHKNTAEKRNYIEDAVAYLQENYTAPITLPALAGRYFVSPAHFSRMFKKETGYPFSEYLNLLRLKKAESLLCQLNASTVTEIAKYCGFNDSNYFSVRFKQRYGLSPKRYQMEKGQK